MPPSLIWERVARRRSIKDAMAAQSDGALFFELCGFKKCSRDEAPEPTVLIGADRHNKLLIYLTSEDQTSGAYSQARRSC